MRISIEGAAAMVARISGVVRRTKLDMYQTYTLLPISACHKT